MKNLYDIATFCSSQKEVILALLPDQPDDPLNKLFNLLYAENKLTNAEAMLTIYGALNVKSFSKLKSRMFGLLIKAISIQSISGAGENIRFNRVIDSMRESLASRIIMYKGSTALSVGIIEDSILGSVEDKLSLNILEQLRILTLYYGTSNYNKYKLNKYNELEDYYFNLLKAETKAIRYFIELKGLQMRSFAETSQIDKQKARRYSKELQSINVSSRVFDFYKYQVFVKNYEFNHEFEKLFALCKDAELTFSTSKNYSISSLIVIKQVKLWTLIQLGKYAECSSLGLPELENKELSATNWYSFLHYVIKANLYSGNYLEAGKNIAYCFNHSNFRKLNEDLQEIANLQLGYIHLIWKSNFLKKYEYDFELPNFKLGKFINATHIFNKDKRGINVSILLMHIAFLLQRKDYNAIIDRTDSLNQYAYRYLRKDDSFRSNCMIKMVIQMTKADFNPIRTDRYTADLRKQLSHVTLAGSGENIEVEIIPFEILWEIMRKTL
jgi:hypothetical protein